MRDYEEVSMREIGELILKAQYSTMKTCDRMVYDRMRNQCRLSGRFEFVFGERRDLEDLNGRRPNKGWEVVRLPDGRTCQRPPPDWGPVITDTMTKLSDGTFAYMFDPGPPLTERPKPLPKPMRKRAIYTGRAKGILGYGMTGYARRLKQGSTTWGFRPDGYDGFARMVVTNDLYFTEY